MSEEKYKEMIVWLVEKWYNADKEGSRIDLECIKELRNWKVSE